MAQSIISEGKTSTEAIENGLKKLNISREEADIRILEEKKKSFFSILDPHVVKVEITVKNEIVHKDKEEEKNISPEEIEKAKKGIEQFLKEFLIKISSEITYEISVSNEEINVKLKGNESTKLIGYRGEALNSLQLILSNIARKNSDGQVKVIVDIEDYREKREKTLEELAEKIEKTIIKTGKKVTLEPMNSYERKIIHTKLQDSQFVKTYSIGENSNRRVVIIKK